MSHKCHKCNHANELKDMPLKMGGMLCVNCRVILFYPYDEDGVYNKEVKRRIEEAKQQESD